MIKSNKIVISIFCLVFFGYLINLPVDYTKSLKTKTYRRLLTSYDVTSATFLPYEIIKYGTLTFSQETIDGMRRVEDDRLHSIIKLGSRYFSSYPILSGVMAIPIYFLPIILNKIPELHYVENLLKILVLGRVSASFYTSISVVIFYLILHELDRIMGFRPSKWNYLYVFFYAFGTNVYSIASRSLWQHTSSLLLISLIILIMLKGLREKKYIKWAGLCAGLLYLSRPLNIVFILLLTAYVLVKHKTQFVRYLLYASPAAALLFTYNTYAWGKPFTSEYVVKGDTEFSTPVLKGVVGNLFSPARSFIFITPPLVLSYVGMYLVLRKKGNKDIDLFLLMLACTYAIIFLLYSKWWCWYGADRFGYGFFTEWLPIIALFSYLVFKPRGRLIKWVFFVMVLWSVFMQFNAVWYRKSRCSGTHNWSFYCLKPLIFSEQEY